MKKYETTLNGPSFEIEPLCLYELFERCAEKLPNNIALVFQQDHLSYKSLNENANKLAHVLLEMGFSEKTRIGIYFTKSIEMVIAIIAINKIGATYIPLDPNFPSNRLKAIIEDSTPACILVNTKINFPLSKDTCEIIEYSYKNEKWSHFDSTNPKEGSFFNNPIYILYTSGSTGNPKGIEQVNRASSNLIQWQNRCMGIDFKKPVLQFTSICFDVSLQEIFSPLSQGGTVIIAGDEERLDVERLLCLIKRYDISTAFLSVSTFLNFFHDIKLLEKIPNCLTDVITAGEQIIVNDSVRTFLSNRPNFRLHNHYGPSEALVITSHIYSYSLNNIVNRPPVGKPIQNVKIKIVPSNKSSETNRKKGEIWVSGICLAKGYINLDDITNKNFINYEKDRWYKTGDIVRLDQKEDIEFLCRTDDQIKIDGKLVELSEIEKIFSLYSKIHEFIIKAFNSENNKVVVGYYTSSERIDSKDLRNHFRDYLPDYMTPTHFINRFNKTSSPFQSPQCYI